MSDARIVTVICTGNICRSPMGAEFLRRRLAELGVDDVHVRSAGTYAGYGAPAVTAAQRAAAALGGDLSRHGSSALTRDVVHGSHLILCAAGEHKDHVLELFGEVDARRVRLFNEPIADSAPPDVDDPLGFDEAFFLRSARVIRQAMHAWADRLAAGTELSA